MITNNGSSFNASISQLIFGKPLQTRDLPHQTVTKPIGLAVFASDALSSTAYAIDEILHILAFAGTGMAILGLSIPIAIAIAVLLVIVTVSYRQTIYAYPNGGGAYIVARDNLGEHAAQVAAAALLTDYILTVAVSISSGVAQVTSAFPELLGYRVEIALAVIAFMTVVNLRGVKESGFIFSIPTYFFLAMMFLTLAVGFFKYLTGALDPVTGVVAIQHEALEPLGVFLILKAFSSGCTALTGIEAISNGITAFKEPRSKNAAITLTWMSGIMATLILGLTFLTNQVGAQSSATETVFSQLSRAIYGSGSILYLLTLGSTFAVLFMAANTSYADFPRLAALAAGDGFLPRQLTYRGGRLVFSWGITGLAMFAALLVVGGGASVSALIPLYAIGVFLSFTISQTGMVIHSIRIGKLKPGEVHQGLETTIAYDPNWRLKAIISAVGALVTAVVAVVFAVTKFTAGAWFIVVLIPVLVVIFFRIHHHYRSVAQALSLRGQHADLSEQPVQTLLLVDDVHRETATLVKFAKSLGHPWRAVHVATNPDKVYKPRKGAGIDKMMTMQERWDYYIGEGELQIIESPYRALAAPLRDLVMQIQEEQPGCFVHFIMGALLMDNFWEQALHQNSAVVFNLAIGDLNNVAITTLPYRINHNGIVQRVAASLSAEPGARADARDRAIRRGTGQLKPPDKS